MQLLIKSCFKYKYPLNAKHNSHVTLFHFLWTFWRQVPSLVQNILYVDEFLEFWKQKFAENFTAILKSLLK